MSRVCRTWRSFPPALSAAQSNASFGGQALPHIPAPGLRPHALDDGLGLTRFPHQPFGRALWMTVSKGGKLTHSAY